MKIIKFFIVALFSFFSISCKNSKEGPVVVETFVDIKILDAKNNNLIGQTERVNFSNLKIFYVIDGNKELVLNNNLDYPKGYTIVKNQSDQNVLRLFLNRHGEPAKTLIQYNDIATDTVSCLFNKSDRSVVCTKIWYNSTLKWEVNNGFSSVREFTAVKEF